MAFAIPAGGARRTRTARRRGTFVPFLLLAPALLWLVAFFVVPTVSLASQSLQTGDIDNGFTLTWNFAVFPDALSEYSPQLLRSFLYGGLSTLLALIARDEGAPTATRATPRASRPGPRGHFPSARPPWTIAPMRPGAR